MPEKNEEEKEIEVLEFSLTSEEIDEFIGKLDFLKKTKTNVSFDVDDSHEFLIHFQGDELPEVSEETDFEETGTGEQEIDQEETKEDRDY